jgi:hypothetical protein
LLFFGGADTAASWTAMPPSKMSATAVRRDTLRSSHAAVRNTTQVPAITGSGRIRAGLRAGRTISSTRPASTTRATVTAATRSFPFMSRTAQSIWADASSAGGAVSIATAG